MTKIYSYQIIILIIACLILIPLSLRSAYNHAFMVNSNLHTTDQDAYLDQINATINGKFYLGDRARMPLYLYLQNPFLRHYESTTEQFVVGKVVNINLSVILLFVIFFTVLPQLRFTSASIFTLILALTLFLPKSAYLQAENLYYALSFLAFFLSLRIIHHPNPKNGLWVGIISALAYLTKASFLPAFYLLIIVSIIQALITTQSESKNILPSSLINHLKPVIITLAVFFVMLSPYLIQNKQIYGRYFYNVCTNFYFWYDDWAQAKQGTYLYGDTIGWPQMPASQIPSLSWYLKTHGVGDIYRRLVSGVVSYQKIFLGFYPGRLIPKYLYYYVLILIILALLKHPKIKPVLVKYKFSLLYLTGFFLLYFLGYTWYLPLAPGQRLILALYPPLLYILFLALVKIVTRIYPRLEVPWFHLPILVFLVFDFLNLIIYILPRFYTGN